MLQASQLSTLVNRPTIKPVHDEIETTNRPTSSFVFNPQAVEFVPPGEMLKNCTTLLTMSLGLHDDSIIAVLNTPQQVASWTIANAVRDNQNSRQSRRQPQLGYNNQKYWSLWCFLFNSKRSWPDNQLPILSIVSTQLFWP